MYVSASASPKPEAGLSLSCIIFEEHESRWLFQAINVLSGALGPWLSYQRKEASWAVWTS